MARALESKWSELTEKQRNRFGDKASFKSAKEEYQASKADSGSSSQMQTGVADSGAGVNQSGQTSSSANLGTGSSGGSGSGVVRERDPNPSDVSKRYYQKWSDLTEAQRAKEVSKSTFKERKAELGLKGINVKADTKTRMAGDALRKLNKQEAPNEAAVERARERVYGVENIDNFDGAAAGAGSKRDYDRLSKSDIKGLRKQGFSQQEILDYAERTTSDTSGEKAQKLLGKFRDNIAAKNPDPEVSIPTPVDQGPVDFIPDTPGTPINPENPGTPGNPSVPAPTPAPAPLPTPTPAPTPTQPYQPVTPPPVVGGDVDDRDVANQDQIITNDVRNEQNSRYDNNSTNNIVGDNNTIDNSYKYFGGNQNTTIINRPHMEANQGANVGGYGGGNDFGIKNLGMSNNQDTTVSDMALGRSTDYDSPGSTAEFAMRHAEINNMMQNDNKVPNFALDSINLARANQVVDRQALDTRISQRPLYSGAMATNIGGMLFGDTYRMQAPNWESALGTGKDPETPDYNKDAETWMKAFK